MIDYDPHRWRTSLFNIRGSMVKEIVARTAIFIAIAAGATVFHFRVRPIDISDRAHSLIGVALGLLLVFRTNASYDRFWEGRKLWGGIVNESRNLARATTVLLGSDGAAITARVLRWTTAFPWAAMHLLRSTRADRFEGLPESEVAPVLASINPPLAIAIKISECLAEARARGLLSDYTQMQLDQNVQLLVDYVGGCERIRNTPLPFAYLIHMRRALILYCVTLPLALLSTYGWWTVLVTMLLTGALIGIEEIGVEIEEPFGTDDNDLPLERICTRIQTDLQELLDRSRV